MASHMKWVAALLCANILISAGTLYVLLKPAQTTLTPPDATTTDQIPPTNDAQASAQVYQQSMFSWEDEPYRMEQRPDFYAALEALGINTVYQSFANENLYSDETKSFLAEMHRSNRKVYYMAGAAEWGLDPTGKAMIDVVNRVAAFNRVNVPESNLAGVLFDVEPYLTDAWDEDKEAVMQSLSAATRATYQIAAEKGVQMIVCMPSWYDGAFAAHLEQIVSEGCDAIAVMNYGRDDELNRIKAEVELARTYKKPVVCIFEFQQAGKHELTENETYYNAGLAAAQESFQALYDHFDYDKLSFSYHYYKPVRELLAGRAE